MDLVDLGLPSGTKWMKYNLGVDPKQLISSTDWYGLYYQWGETTGYKDASGIKKFSWSDYPLVTNSIINLTRDMDKDKTIGSTTYHAFSNSIDEPIYAFSTDYSFIFKYDEVNNKMISISNGGAMYNRYGITGVYFVDETMPVLDSKHDAVSVKYGTDYHMPTKAQLQELKNNTTHELVTNYNGISNLNGLLFTSIVNGNELFFPLSGICKDGNNEQINVESEILSNELRIELPKTNECLLMTIDNTATITEMNRSLGVNIRGVKN